MISYDESRKILNTVPALIEKTFPIPGRFKRQLPRDIFELSKLLTNNRGQRSLSYLNKPNYLSAYLHYFLPWNLYRLCLLLPKLNLNICANDTIVDIGCGPLTFASALWITYPDLRNIPLEINCIDRVSSIMDAGKDFFSALSVSSQGKWKIKTIKKDINIQKHESLKLHDNPEKIALVCVINMFNEIYDNLSHSNTEGLRRMAKDAALFLHKTASKNASILTMEPGIPQSGKFISFLRDAFLELGRMPVSPCTHFEKCPLDFSSPIKKDHKQKWCHFAFETTSAPKALQSLSIAAKLPKERLVFSYLQTGSSNDKPEKNIRILSDFFPLPDGMFGRYGCSASGLILLTGNKNSIDNLHSFDIYTQNTPKKHENLNSSVCSTNGTRDKKSGALIIEIK